MYSKIYLISAFAFMLMLFSANSFAQNGGVEVRFAVHSLDCETSELCFDIQLRASEPGREFYLSEQNYRFSFNRVTNTTPTISEELEVSDLILGEGAQGFSVYSPHTLIGSLDTLISYNVELSGGDGLYITSTDYISVGRICAEVLDFNEFFFLDWVVDEFPGSYVGEYYQGERYGVEIVSYTGYFQDLSGVCDNSPPVAANDIATINPNGHVTICLPVNDTDADTEIDPSSVELFNIPPASEGTVTLDPQTGCMTFIAAENFTGISTFQYQICDTGTSIPSYVGDDNPDLIPDANTPNISVTEPACDVATVEIGVGVSVDTQIADAAFFKLITFPNPADDVVNINYTLSEKADIGITLLNVLGQPVLQLETETILQGEYNESLNISELSKGNYFVVLNVNGKIATKSIQIK